MEKRPLRTVLVTTGATEPFRALLENCASQAVLETLQELGFERLVVQCGTGLNVFRRALDNSIGNKNNSGGRMIVDSIDFVSDLTKLMRDADLIISHAGTGSILDALRADRKLIVVVNNSLMDNHQQDVADKLQAHDYLIVSAVDPPSLAASVRASVSKSFSSLPPPNASKLGYIVDEEIARSQ